MSYFYSFALLCFSFLVFTPAFAAYNDVSLTTDAVVRVTVSGQTVDLSVSGSTAAIESINVEASVFTVQLNNQSSITLSSSNRYDINVDNSSVVTSEVCNATESKITLASTDSSVKTVVVMPTTDTCQTSGGGGGGGGGGSTSVKKTETNTTTPPATPVISPAPIQTFARTAVFSRSLSIGATGEDVLQLQQFLNSDSDTRVAESGMGSPGSETNYFGPLTAAAVQKFQLKHGVVVSSADPGFGFVGPKTRAKLEELSGRSVVGKSSSSIAQIIADLLKQVEVLQAQLELIKAQQ